MSSPGERKRKAVIVGAGPVGCLAALALAKHGWSVEVYEVRPGVSGAQVQTLSVFLVKSPTDMRIPSSKAASQQRSINLAISHRGIAALEAVNPAAAQRFLKDAIPMRGRMIHTLSGKLDSQKYDRDGQVRISSRTSLCVSHTTLIPSIPSLSIPSTGPSLTKASWTKPLLPIMSR